jgi:hypothetical protein
MVPCGCMFRSCGRGVRQRGDILNLNRAWHAPQPSPERTGGAQFLGGCLGKPGDCVLSPDTRPSTRARHASQSDPIAHGVVSDCPRRRVAARIGRSYSCGFRGSQAPGQTALSSKRCATLALPRRLRMDGTNEPSHIRAIRLASLFDAGVGRASIEAAGRTEAPLNTVINLFGSIVCERKM